MLLLWLMMISMGHKLLAEAYQPRKARSLSGTRLCSTLSRFLQPAVMPSKCFSDDCKPPPLVVSSSKQFSTSIHACCGLDMHHMTSIWHPEAATKSKLYVVLPFHCRATTEIQVKLQYMTRMLMSYRAHVMADQCWACQV